jgi:hypothetical protein|tara:strand:- start:2142 stop:2333 length:192 start_codon:yes stop_codon:yes gene_type:complete
MIEDYTAIFRQRLSGQAEVCARKTLEWLQKDLQGERLLDPREVFYLASAAQLMLTIRDTYGEE